MFFVDVFNNCETIWFSPGDAFASVPEDNGPRACTPIVSTTFAVIERTALGEDATFKREKFLAALRLVLESIRWRRMISLA